MRDWVENNSAPARIRTWVLALLAGVALVLGIIGIYGVLAYLVTLRRHEFGVRLALGARPGKLIELVLAHGLGLVPWVLPQALPAQRRWRVSSKLSLRR